jgi:hypothetical protein
MFVRSLTSSSDRFLALNKLEKVALRISQKRGWPIVLIINNVHHFKNDEEGRGMLLQLQQKAEAWAESGMLAYFSHKSIVHNYPVITRHRHYGFHLVSPKCLILIALLCSHNGFSDDFWPYHFMR